MAFFDLLPHEEKSFLSTVHHTVLEGKLKLIRFSDSSIGHKAAYGAFWMYASEVVEILEGVGSNGPYGLQFIREISERWAHCDNWGDLQRAWVMTIPHGLTLNAYWGFAKFQPRISVDEQTKSGRRTDNYYKGGSIQLVTRVRNQEKQWIQGPFRTLDFSAKKLRT